MLKPNNNLVSAIEKSFMLQVRCGYDYIYWLEKTEDFYEFKTYIYLIIINKIFRCLKISILICIIKSNLNIWFKTLFYNFKYLTGGLRDWTVIVWVRIYLILLLYW